LIPGRGRDIPANASRLVLEPTQPPIQWVTWTLSLEVRRLGREAAHSLPSGMHGVVPPLPHTSSRSGAWLSTATILSSRNVLRIFVSHTLLIGSQDSSVGWATGWMMGVRAR
jgi:hypothetical protein